MNLTKKESLQHVIETKGKCTTLLIECCSYCLVACAYKDSVEGVIPPYITMDEYFDNKYRQAVSLFLELYGVSELVEILL